MDIVYLTHLHVDHIGRLTRKIGGNWTPTFANARHLVLETEFEFWTSAKVRSGTWPDRSPIASCRFLRKACSRRSHRATRLFPACA
ncbi:hypothetical protein [Roseibium sp.]|uniref:hypothetical protein n=1 Tax=Roseibium sp. TaxID=1936156 RepID=UPI003D105020